MKQRIWINFKELRARLNSEEVLRLYGVEINRKGAQHQGCCPLPGHQGERRSPSFSVNLERGIFQCFRCRTKGNILEFAALMQGVNPEDGAALRSVAVELQSKFLPDGASSRAPDWPASVAPPEPRDIPVLINPPLNFELKGLDRNHEWFARSRFSLDTMQRFGVGYCSRGLLQGKLAIPLHDHEGKLIGYAGLEVGKEQGNQEKFEFTFPYRREHTGKIFEFHKDRFLYNGHRLGTALEDVVVVQDIHSVWWLFQNGVRGVVATMAKELSSRQVAQLLSLLDESGTAWILTSGGEEGDALGFSVLRQVAEHRSVRCISCKADSRPVDLDPNELKAKFSW